MAVNKKQPDLDKLKAISARMARYEKALSSVSFDSDAGEEIRRQIETLTDEYARALGLPEDEIARINRELDDPMSTLTEPEKEQYAELQAKRATKFDQICELVRKQLGYKSLDKLSDQEHQQVIEEAEELAENWDEASLEDWNLLARTELQRLLAEHHEIGEQIVDLQDTAFARSSGVEDEEG
jgi:hypothetical protein